MASVSLKDIIEKMKLENLTPELDISKVKITQPDINRIALQMAGYFEHFEATRMQIIGFVEYTYMQGLPDEKKKEIYTKLLSFDIPGIDFCRELQPDPMFMEMAMVSFHFSTTSRETMSDKINRLIRHELDAS